MNEHDRDLILGLADGSLTGDDAAAARARIDADPELASELAVQESVRSGLDALPALALTEAERTQLRAGLRTQLHLDDAPAPVTAPPARRRGLRWQPIVGLGAAAVFVTAVVILPATLGGGSDDSGSDEALMTTTVAAFEAPVIEESDAAASGTAEDGAETAPPSALVPELDDVDGADLLDTVEQADTPEQLTRSIVPRTTGAGIDIDIRSAEQCLERLGSGLPGGDKTLMGADETDDGLVLYFAVLEDGSESVITVNLDACSVVAIDR